MPRPPLPRRPSLAAITLALLATRAGAAPPGLSPESTARLRALSDTRNHRLGLPTSITPLPDGSAVLFLRAAGPRTPQLRLQRYDVKTHRVDEPVSIEALLGPSVADEKIPPEERARRERLRITTTGLASYELAPDGQHVLVTVAGRVHVVDLVSGTSVPVAGPDRDGRLPFDARLSPDGARVGFVRGGELWVAPTGGGAEKQLTRGATPSRTHAVAEFVAQEEMGRATGWWWSPDGSQVVYQENDASAVEEVHLVDPASPFVAVPPAQYPRPGKPNVRVTLAIAPTKGGPARPVQWDRERYPYLARVLWPAHSPLTIQVQSRDQKDLVLLIVDPATGKTREILREHDDSWVNLSEDYRWLPDGSGFLWSSERTGPWRLELRDAAGALVRTLTPADLGYRHLRRLDWPRREVVVTAGHDPLEQRLHALSLDGAAPRELPQTQGVPAPWLDAAYAARGDLAVFTTSSLDRPDRSEVYAGSTWIGSLPSIAEEPAPIAEGRVTLDRAPLGDNPQDAIHTALVRPTRVEPGRRYPVLVHVYGGPHSNQVSRSFHGWPLRAWLADQGYFVIVADGRGTPLRGAAWERAIRGRFAEEPMAAQIAAVRHWAAREPAIDPDRVGIYGASFGGYASALAVIDHPATFHAAVAVAPVVDWLDYDTHYTERYLGIPGAGNAEVLAAYARSGLVDRAANLTRPLLLVHGTVDDNVHFDQSLKLTAALFRAGRPVELLPLSGQTHLPRDPVLLTRYWERVLDFFARALPR